MAEFPIFNPSRTELEYVAQIKKISGYYYANERPPLENEILFLHEEGKFKKNIMLEYSPYLTLLYGYEQPRDYSDKVKSQIGRWNRVISRYANDQKITKKNEEVRAEIEKCGYDFEQIVYTAKQSGIEPEEE